ncbi:hypothetical protein IFM89_006153 [Coptis chinensis]|uniref:Uncharacterized protein n=1 Tax=Coptis chinensis TaxID=261450 RepID=A0A835GVU0_9MAGN|nr:hypothetical protein IFM89_006153 [Coptis chinensis]
MTRHKSTVAEFLTKNYVWFYADYNSKLLESPTYITRKQAVKLLGDMLCDRANYMVMALTAYPFYMRNSPKWLNLSFMYIYKFIVLPINKLVAQLVNLVSQALGWLMQNTIGIRENEDRSIEEHKALLQTNNFRVRDWTLRKGLKDMERWMELSSSESTLHLRKLLSTKNPSRESLNEELVWRFYSKARSEVSCLSILILAELAKMSMPNSITASLMKDTLDEVFDIIYFIDSKMNTRNFCNKIKSMSAEVLWKGKTTGRILRHKKVKKLTDGMLQSPSELDHTLGFITDFHHLFAVDVVRDEDCVDNKDNRVDEVLRFQENAIRTLGSQQDLE